MILGWLSAVLLGACMLPQVYKVIEEGNAHGTAMWTVILWFLGEVLGLAYVWLYVGTAGWPLLANFGLNLVLSCLLLGYKIKDRGPQWLT